MTFPLSLRSLLACLLAPLLACAPLLAAKGGADEKRAEVRKMHDQLFFMRRVGFDAYALKDGKSVETALASGFATFSQPYQGATDQPLPAFRRNA